jgi:hypothetical protein
MLNMDVWDWVLLAVGAFVAVTTLAGLMRRRRDEVLAELTAEAKEQQRQKRIAAARERKKQKSGESGAGL